jgi:hypothetical protein
MWARGGRRRRALPRSRSPIPSRLRRRRLEGAAVCRLEGEYVFAKVIEKLHVLLHVAADDGRLVHRRRGLAR